MATDPVALLRVVELINSLACILNGDSHVLTPRHIYMAAHSNGQAIIFCSCGFCLLSFLFLSFSSPNLSDRRLDVYHISVHDVALMRI